MIQWYNDTTLQRLSLNLVLVVSRRWSNPGSNRISSLFDESGFRGMCTTYFYYFLSRFVGQFGQKFYNLGKKVVSTALEKHSPTLCTDQWSVCHSLIGWNNFTSVKVVTSEKIGGSRVISTLSTWYGGEVMGVLLLFNEAAILYRHFNCAPLQKQNIIVFAANNSRCCECHVAPTIIL
jgi:hypothetical protein